jgi:hypothetical protein
MLATLNLWIIRRRLALALRREETARNRVAAERRLIAQLEEELGQAEITVLVGAYYRE